VKLPKNEMYKTQLRDKETRLSNWIEACDIKIVSKSVEAQKKDWSPHRAAEVTAYPGQELWRDVAKVRWGEVR